MIAYKIRNRKGQYFKEFNWISPNYYIKEWDDTGTFYYDKYFVFYDNKAIKQKTEVVEFEIIEKGSIQNV